MWDQQHSSWDLESQFESYVTVLLQRGCHNKYLSKCSNIKILAACKLGIRFTRLQSNRNALGMSSIIISECAFKLLLEREKKWEIKAGEGFKGPSQGLGALWSRRQDLQSGIHRCNRQLAPLTGSFVRKVHKYAAHNEALLSYRVAGTGHLTTGGLMSLPTSVTRALSKNITGTLIKSITWRLFKSISMY